MKNTLPQGASSIVVPSDSVSWQVFTGITYQGTTVTLEPGRMYKNYEEMGLQQPVISFHRKAS